MFLNRLKHLSELAEPENWYYSSPKAPSEEANKFGVLYQYINNTFEKAQKDNLILQDTSDAIFNTGLITAYGEEIYMLFEKNDSMYPSPWRLRAFLKASDRRIPEQFVDKLPGYVDYFKDHPEQMYFDPRLTIQTSMEHIIEDHFERLPATLRSLEPSTIPQILQSAMVVMRKKIQRNNRLVVPQYYNGSITYLAPLTFGKDVIPLAIERIGNSYRVNSVFTPGMAYCNARLLMRPESTWLKNGK